MNITVEIHTLIEDTHILFSKHYEIECNNGHDDKFIDFQTKIEEHFSNYSIDLGGCDNSIEFDFCGGEISSLKEIKKVTDYIFSKFKKEFVNE